MIGRGDAVLLLSDAKGCLFPWQTFELGDKKGLQIVNGPLEKKEICNSTKCPSFSLIFLETKKNILVLFA